MAKRGYKLQEFVAHAGNVNCLTFGKKNCRVFITGGDDQKVNLWSVGKPTSLMSLCGHTSPVESASFDSAEVLVVAGSSSGAIKLWDMEETKLVRTLTGHRSYCTAVEFHPFGEFFASGSMDTNLKIWDIRKKGCIHTYKGHTRGISTIRFSPDGRWVVSGGFDNVVKVWDLTAGKLLHDFKFHEGHVRSIEFHPLEFLLATGSADKTVKFWDLETFEMIGSARREATGVRSMTFHPDGRNLFCGLDDSVKVYSWEPVICHDSVDMGWSTLGDLCINDGKLLGGAYYENSVAVWVADVSLMEPYGSKLPPEKHIHAEQKINSEGSLLEKEESHVKSKSNLRCTTPDSDSNDIKTIYIDRVNSIASKKVEPLDPPKVVLPPDSKESSTAGIQKLGSAINLGTIKSVTSKTVDPPETPKVALTSDSKVIDDVGIQKSGLAMSLPSKTNVRAGNRSLVMPNIVPRDGPDGKKSVGSRRDSIGPPKTSNGMSAKPHARRLSSSPFEMGRMSVSLDSVPHDNLRTPLGSRKDSNLRSRHVAEQNAKESSEGKESSIKTVLEKFDRDSSLETVPSTGSCDQTESSSKGVKPVRVVNGVAVVHGRTRSLVERFEKREVTDVDETNTPARASGVTFEPVETPSSQVNDTEPRARASHVTSEPVETPLSWVDETVTRARASRVTSEPVETPPSQVAETIPRARASRVTSEPVETPPSRVDETITRARASRVTSEPVETPPSQVAETIPRASASCVTSEPVETPLSRVDETVTRARAPRVTSEPVETPTSQVAQTIIRARASRMTADPVETPSSRVNETVTRARASRVTSEHVETPPSRVDDTVRQARASRVTAESEEIPLSQSGGQPFIMREEPTMRDDNIIQNLIQNHDVLLRTFRSRLTKLQVVRHFWERNDIKGAISAVRKLPDRAVQADVVGVLVDRMEIITLDLFSCLLPMLLGLLDSKVERHSTVSLEMLLKLVAVFGTVIRSTVSAPPAVGVDLHLEERRECCRQCFAHLQNIQKIIPELVRRGGNVARCAQQLNLILQQP